MGQQISACRQVLELNSCRFAVNKLLQVRISECFVNTWVLANMTEQLLQTLRMLATAKTSNSTAHPSSRPQLLRRDLRT